MIPYILFFISILIMAVIILGLNLSKNIEQTIIYFLFWLLYIITILSIINIVLSIYYYLNVRDKRGPAGIRGINGEHGEIGDVGKCDPKCRESLCTDGIINAIQEYIISLEPNKPIKLNNIYIKQKIKSLCESPQFQELSPYKGANNLIKFLIEVWKIWIDLLYNEGGRIYFETIGAEMEWEWMENNPFEEIKKYDVFYWGLDKEYYPDIIKQCYTKDESGQIILPPEGLIKTTITNNMIKIGVLSSGTYSASIWHPKNITYENVNYYPIGDILVGPNNINDTRHQKIRYSNLQLDSTITSPVINTYLVGGKYIAPPVDYNLLWTNNSIWIWRPIGPITNEGEYIAMGDIATNISLKPSINESAPIRCVLKSALSQLKTPHQMLWKTSGTHFTPITIFGYCPYNGKTTPLNAADTNSYNVFRLSPNTPNSISLTDEKASFYYIKPEYYEINDQPGKDKGRPYAGKDNKYKGKGWIKGETKNSKYSILAYLNLKPNMNVKSKDNTTQIELINNTTFGNSNSYIAKYNGRCLEVHENAIILKLCNFNKITQCFRIEMTGKTKGEFQLYHINTGMFLQCKLNKFKLATNGNNNTIFYII